MASKQINQDSNPDLSDFKAPTFFFFFGLYHTACVILVSQPGMAFSPPASEAWSQPLDRQGSPSKPILLTTT